MLQLTELLPVLGTSHSFRADSTESEHIDWVSMVQTGSDEHQKVRSLFLWSAYQ